MSAPENKSLISWFGLFCLGNTGSNLGPEKISLISEFLLYQGYTVIVLLWIWWHVFGLVIIQEFFLVPISFPFLNGEDAFSFVLALRSKETCLFLSLFIDQKKDFAAKAGNKLSRL